MNKATTKNKTSAWILIAVILCAAVIPVFVGLMVTVNAASYDPLYDRLYYFSDYVGCEDYVNSIDQSENGDEYWHGFLNSTLEDYKYNVNIDFDTEIVLYNWSNEKLEEDEDGVTFVQMVENYHTSEQYKNIHNSFVIFEMRNELPIDVLDDGSGNMLNEYIQADMLEYIDYRPIYDNSDKFVYILRDIFRTLKENECKIMVIFGTDEVRFTEGNEYSDGDSFLNYVDIQIDLDTFYVYIDSIFQYIESECDFSNCIIALDYSLSDMEFFAGYFFPYAIDMYYKDDFEPKWDYPIDMDKEKIEIMEILYKDRNVKFIIDDVALNSPIFNYCYYTAETGKFIRTVGSLDDDYLSNETVSGVYMIGSMQDYGKNFDTWLDCQNILSELGYYYSISTYLYNGFNYDEYIYDVYNLKDYYIYDDGFVLSNLNRWLPRVVYDFIMGNDLSVYDNYDSSCPVCLKALLSGSGGWMKSPRARDAGKKVMSTDIFVKLYGGIKWSEM